MATRERHHFVDVEASGRNSASGTVTQTQMEKGNMNASHRGNHRGGKKQGSGVIYYILLILTILVFIGLFFSFTMMPSGEQSNSNNGLGTNPIISRNTGGGEKLKPKPKPKPLIEKITNWIPKHHVNASAPDELLPDYSQEFWTPIDIEIDTDPIIVLCKLNFKQYSQAPHLYPMFKDLLGASGCTGSNKKRESLSTLMNEIEEDQKAGRPGGNVIKPTGFVFHESRVGSTLVANFLASDPYNMVLPLLFLYSTLPLLYSTFPLLYSTLLFFTYGLKSKKFLSFPSLSFHFH